MTASILAAPTFAAPTFAADVNVAQNVGFYIIAAVMIWGAIRVVTTKNVVHAALWLVVVLGGVGQLTGTVYAALGLGVLNKLLEGWQGAVLAKIMVLVFIVIFIQKRPQGIFAMKGRSAEA